MTTSEPTCNRHVSVHLLYRPAPAKHLSTRTASQCSPPRPRKASVLTSVPEYLAVVSAPALLGAASRDERKRARVSTVPLVVVLGVAGVAEALAAEHVADVPVASVAENLHAEAVGVAFFIDCVRDHTPESRPAAAAIELHLRGEERLAAACAHVDALLFQVVEAAIRNTHLMPRLCGFAAQNLNTRQLGTS